MGPVGAEGITGKSASPTTHTDIVHRLDIANHCIAVGLTGKSASPTTHPDIVHRPDIANHCVAVFRDTLTYFRRRLIDCRNADQSAPRVYPDAIFRISVAHHIFALHGIELDENFIEVVAQQFWDCHLSFSMFLCTSDLDDLDVATVNEQFNAGDEAQALLLLKGESISVVAAATG